MSCSCWPPPTRRRCCPPSAAAPSTSSSACSAGDVLERPAPRHQRRRRPGRADRSHRPGRPPRPRLGPRRPVGARPGRRRRRRSRTRARSSTTSSRRCATATSGRALAAVAEACAAGRDPRRLPRNCSPTCATPSSPSWPAARSDLPDEAADRAEEQGRRLGPAAWSGPWRRSATPSSQMREALDPRVSPRGRPRAHRPPRHRRVACRPLERIERLERGGGAQRAPVPAEPTAERGAMSAATATGSCGCRSRRPGPKKAPGATHEDARRPRRRKRRPASASCPRVATSSPPRGPTTILPTLAPQGQRAVLRGRFVSVDGRRRRLRPATELHRAGPRSTRPTSRTALAAHFGRRCRCTRRRRRPGHRRRPRRRRRRRPRRSRLRRADAPTGRPRPRTV